MSILIKGLEMPKAGEILYVDIYSDGRVIKASSDAGDSDDLAAVEKIAEAVEIKTPHGRLIDADAILQDPGKAMHVVSENLYHESIIKYAPAIIEAEE